MQKTHNCVCDHVCVYVCVRVCVCVRAHAHLCAYAHVCACERQVDSVKRKSSHTSSLTNEVQGQLKAYHILIYHVHVVPRQKLLCE